MQSDHGQNIVELFDHEYRWWEDVYNVSLPNGFLSFEMIKRKEIFLQILDKYLRPLKGGKILDCGCGPGNIIKDICTDSEVYGIDINYRYLSKANADSSENSKFINCDIERLPFACGIFDVVFCIGVLSYLKQDKEAISEIARVTKYGGIIIIALPNIFRIGQMIDPWYAFSKVSKHLLKNADKPDASFFKMRRYTTRKLHPLYRSNSLRQLEVVGTSYGPVTFMKRKLFDLSRNIRISEGLRLLSRLRRLKILNHLSNHWIACLQKSSN